MMMMFKMVTMMLVATVLGHMTGFPLDAHSSLLILNSVGLVMVMVHQNHDEKILNVQLDVYHLVAVEIQRAHVAGTSILTLMHGFRIMRTNSAAGIWCNNLF